LKGALIDDGTWLDQPHHLTLSIINLLTYNIN